MDRETFAERRVTVTSHRLEAIDEVHFARCRDIQRVPRLLSRRIMHTGVGWREVVLELRKS